MNEAIILAGGLGTRLKDTVPDLPKPMAPVNGKPFLWYNLIWLERSGIGRVIISAGYKAESITDYFGNSFRGMEIEYAIEEHPLGTGGAVKNALSLAETSSLIILNGDTYFPIDLNLFKSFHNLAGSQFSVALKLMEDFSRYGSVECEGDIIVKFNEKKSCDKGLINGGIYLINRDFIESTGLPDIFSLEKDLLEKLAGTGTLRCKVFDDLFVDIGVPEDYFRAQELLSDNS